MTVQQFEPSLAGREFEYWLRRYKRTWRGTVVVSIANPLLFLIAIGAGLGRLIPDSAALGGVSYLAFFAPGMLAAASMQNGVVESAFPVSWARRSGGSYQVAGAGPLEPADILIGHTLFMAFKIAMGAAAFLVVMVAMGAARSPLVVLDLPAALLTGLAFATPTAAWVITVDRPGTAGTLFKWVVMPLYLFSGTFFPIAALPVPVRVLAYVSPLWHGADLCRSLSLGTASWGMSAVHVGYLLTLTGLGLYFGLRTYRAQLHS
jgi:ABC-type polysaccharide/polyol phosphate export permease